MLDRTSCLYSLEPTSPDGAGYGGSDFKVAPTAEKRGWLRPLTAPVDIASLVLFRIGFGALILFFQVWRYLDRGKLAQVYIEPKLHFTYYGFEWVRPWPGVGMYIHLAVLAAAAAGVMLGLWYRVSAVLLFLTWTYIFLLDQIAYNNHYYLLSLIGFLMIFIPAHRAVSIDAWRRPAIRSDWVPRWSVWLIRAQIGIVYFYGGLAKIDADWLRGSPLHQWAEDRTTWKIIGSGAAKAWSAYGIAYSGLVLDLFIVPLLIWRRTRVMAFMAALLFHVSNSQLFVIGIFPWFMIAATTMFFAPDWPRRLLRRIRPRSAYGTPRPLDPAAMVHSHRPLALVGVFMALQLLVPFRHHLYPGNPSWTEEAHLFSWRMMLRQKDALARFFVTNRKTNETIEVDAADYLHEQWVRQMSGIPEHILEFSRYLRDKFGGDGIEVRVVAYASLNGREPELLIDPTVDLATKQRSWKPFDWLMPQTEPLPTPEEQRRRGYRDDPLPVVKGTPRGQDMDAMIPLFIQQLRREPNLRILYLTDTIFTDAGLAFLEGLDGLEALDLSGTQVSDAGIRYLETLRNLRVLNVTGTGITDAGEQELKQAMPGLRINR